VLQQYLGEQLVARSGSLRPGGWALTPFIEGPDAVRLAVGTQTPEDSGRREGFGGWVRGHLTRTPSMASAATYFAMVYSSSTSSAGTTTASCWSPAQAFSRTCNCRIDLRSHRGTYTLHDLINHFDTEDNLNQQMMCDGTPLLCPEIHQRRQQQDRGRGWELGCRRWGACQRA
jgi:hypothetical protein